MKLERWWPWLLIIGAAVIAYVLGVRRDDGSAMLMTAMLVILFGAYFIIAERRKP